MKHHCSICLKQLKKDQQVYMDDFYAIKHPECFEWNPEYILDKGTFQEIVIKYPKYFKDFNV
ncbi:hypothetical protein SM124_01480 [Bacillus sp. 31A1R]|uniref:PARP-type domain-containing protein n=1 Tax=Robertmurraya mangrovi TaxID=3098077 RepID=A0ABU5ITC3_9BACI|nr:hypothetical protein [Bacillus sp. 31A1R]MDZ5470408.1 hypothetical protein [Bacillus sp. 31A1R]